LVAVANAAILTQSDALSNSRISFAPASCRRFFPCGSPAMRLDPEAFSAALTAFSRASGGTEEKLQAAIQKYLTVAKAGREEPHAFHVGGTDEERE
jgi:hypothetical protein